jgi:uncharacterized membrane protein YgcG
MEIRNTTRRPLRVPQPAGKTLHLGPLRTGQISDKAADHPPLRKLIDEGVIEIVSSERSQGTKGSGGGSGVRSSRGHSSGGGMRQTGDR